MIVVAHQGALGDFLLALAALEGLAQSRPVERFLFRTRREHAALIANKTYVAGFRPGDDSDLAPFFLARGWEAAPLPRDLAQAQAVLVFGQSRSTPLVTSLSRRLQCPVRWIQSFPPDSVRQHVSQFISAQLQAFGWEVKPVALRLKPSPQALLQVGSLLADEGLGPGERFMVLHAGSGGRRKIWPFAGWRMLLKPGASGWPVRLVTVLGPADDPVRGLMHEMAEAVGLRVIEGLDLPFLAALLSRAAAYVGNDSGVTHLAAAMGVPTVALFGPTPPEVWAPAGEHVRVLCFDWSESGVHDPGSPRVHPSDAERVRRELLSVLAGSGAGNPPCSGRP